MSRIKHLRMARGYSLDELAERMGGVVTKQALSKYETGKAKPTPTVAISLANALGVKTAVLFAPQKYQIDFIAYRKLSGLSANRQREVEALLAEQLEQRLDLEERLGLPCEFRVERRLVRNAAEVEDAALALRRQWDLGLEPIANLTDVLERKGVHVIEVSDVPEKFHGLSAVAHGDGRQLCGALIAYRGGVDGERQRSTAAHELGHLVINVAEELPEEKVVQSFASSFKMPAELMYEVVGRHRQHFTFEELRTWKQFFGASMQAIVYRAKTLGIISERYATDIFMIFSQRGWRKAEPYPLPPEQPTYWPQLIQRACAEGVITAQEANRLVPGSATGDTHPGLDRHALLKLPSERRRALLQAQADAVEGQYRPGTSGAEWADEFVDEDVLDDY